jgi:molybdenum cofactor cytidylyltransferase
VVVAEPHAAAARAAAAGHCDAIVVNPEPARGMGSSLAEAVRTLDPDRLGPCAQRRVGRFDVALSWPVDHPLVRPETVRAVLDAAAVGNLVIPRFGGRGGHPTAFGAALFGELIAAAALPGGARNVVARDHSRVVTLDLDDPGVGVDVDTPEVLATLQ